MRLLFTDLHGFLSMRNYHVLPKNCPMCSRFCKSVDEYGLIANHNDNNSDVMNIEHLYHISTIVYS